MRPFLLSLVPVGTFAAFVLSPAPASACAAACEETVVLPGSGSSIPASAPGLPIVGAKADAATFELRDSAGALVPGTLKTVDYRQVFVPASALTPGEHTLSTNKSCAGKVVTSTFTVTAGAPPPTKTGTLGVKRAAREELQAGTSSGSCTEDVDAGLVDLDLASDPSVSPYLPITAWETKVDGEWWAGYEPGEVQTAPSGDARSYLRLFTACDGITSQGRDDGLAAGVHDVEVRAILVGGAPMKPATLRVTVSCGADNGTVVAPQGEPPPAIGTPATTDEPTTDEEPTAPSSTDSAAADGGCSAAPHRVPSPSFVFLGIGALGLLGTMRRRPRRR